MRIVDRIDVVRKELDTARGAGRSAGLVPTMGALHAGHTSLIERSAATCDVTLVTIFVNPLQFGPAEDLARYPRDLDGDAATAAAAGADMVFAPPVEEMYPEPVLTTVSVAGPGAAGLEAATRPGHFAGVATVVAKLFAIVGPCTAFFGEKDYQQLLVVRRLATDLSFPVDVVACPTVRDADGLVLSSRNAYLSADERRAAAVVHRALHAGAAAARGGARADAVRRLMADAVAAEPLARLDYAEVAHPDTLEPLTTIDGAARLLVAAWIGTTRLIDNLGVTV